MELVVGIVEIMRLKCVCEATIMWWRWWRNVEPILYVIGQQKWSTVKTRIEAGRKQLVGLWNRKPGWRDWHGVANKVGGERFS